jgi:opacity protein-like surface antigen
MKKLLAAGSIVLALSTTLFATEGHWYVGGEYGTGSGERTYDGTVSVDFDSELYTAKVGYQKDNFDKVEFQYTSKTLENSNNSSDADDVTEYKVNFVISILKLSYKEMVIPYWEAAIGYGDSDNYGGQLATHIGAGIMVNPVEQVEINVGYRYSINAGSTDYDVSYSDQHGDFIIGAAYKF